MMPRLKVQERKNLADEITTALQNHSPDMICVDEIGTELEAKAASEVALSGVQVLASVHASDGIDLVFATAKITN